MIGLQKVTITIIMHMLGYIALCFVRGRGDGGYTPPWPQGLLSRCTGAVLSDKKEGLWGLRSLLPWTVSVFFDSAGRFLRSSGGSNPPESLVIVRFLIYLKYLKSSLDVNCVCILRHKGEVFLQLKPFLKCQLCDSIPVVESLPLSLKTVSAFLDTRVKYSSCWNHSYLRTVSVFLDMSVKYSNTETLPLCELWSYSYTQREVSEILYNT